ncbi:hypothetical protein FC99_GL000251 [Levilactobacillus koreensis JCM 16448]|uniref:Uncharacterized protein n=2 Tax=Levilactobacillus koreensis TaxID=637971 RepID=A0AAC8UWL4_9LACO|nr:hypothetical protein [Levilactobacillus koreensis]AKP64450.1 hypothetical protein ABN16_05185 [Levilactobacillus koreensis]KRK92539.1 hypothetical protein FC99_GL000251 [Levilactobacillus koreensis JCM 16448]
MSDLHGPEQLIVNELLNHGIFTSTITPQTSRQMADAINALKRPQTQQRLNSFFKGLLGVVPDNYQENLLFLPGNQRLDADSVHVFLATLKAVINLPELQNQQSDRVVLTQTIVRQVHSEVVNLDEKEIRRRITALFVDRFGLFTPDMPEVSAVERTEEIDDYWDVSPDFNYVAACLVEHLQAATVDPEPTPLQRVNRALLTQRYVDRSSRVWLDLVTHKAEIAEQWAQLDRFDLECGDDYALLLDKSRKKSEAKPAVVAVAVARSLGVGLPTDTVTTRIHQIIHQLFPESTINVTLVKQALTEMALVRERDGYVSPTPIAHRFSMRTQQATTEEK